MTTTEIPNKFNPGDKYIHAATGAEFIAEPEDQDSSCKGCAGDYGRPGGYSEICTAIPCSRGIIWKPINHQAEALASILRIQNDNH